MNNQGTGLRIAAVIFAIVCLGHVWRVVGQVDILFGHYQVPMWPSEVAIVVAGGLSIWLWSLSKNRGS